MNNLGSYDHLLLYIKKKKKVKKKKRNRMARSIEEYPRQEKQERGSGLVLMISSPFQGHLNPIFQLATLLHSRGFSITIIHPTFNSPNPSNHPPDFIFQPFSDGLSAADVAAMDLCSLISTLNLKCEAPFRDCLARILSEKAQEKVIRCIICDPLMHFSLKVAHELGVPRLAVRTSSTTSFVAFISFHLLRERGYLPPHDRQSEDPIPELHPLRVKDLPWLDSAVPKDPFQLVENMVEATKASSGVIWNSSHCLESTALSKIQQDFQIPMFPIGPLHLYSSSTSSNSLLTEDQSCIAWLDKHPPRSVIYVSFGSLAWMGREELVETAWGLANTNRPFLWVVRANSVIGSKRVELPQGFMEETCERGHVVGWAPQQQVLAHPAVGAFWTHSGWNSTLESASAGVPMICWPCFGDQQVNARYVSHVWRVGVQLENGGVIDRKSIERAVRKLMAEREGEEIRERAKEVKEIVGRSIKEGGSSYHSLNHLVHHIMSL